MVGGSLLFGCCFFQHTICVCPGIDPANRAVTALVARCRRAFAIRSDHGPAFKNLPANLLQINFNRLHKRAERLGTQCLSAVAMDFPRAGETVIKLVSLRNVGAAIKLRQRANIETPRVAIGQLAGLFGIGEGFAASRLAFVFAPQIDVEHARGDKLANTK